MHNKHIPPYEAPGTHLQHLQLLQTLLHEFLYPSLLRLILVFSKAIARSSLGVFAEVICCELAALAKQGAILSVIQLVVIPVTQSISRQYVTEQRMHEDTAGVGQSSRYGAVAGGQGLLEGHLQVIALGTAYCLCRIAIKTCCVREKNCYGRRLGFGAKTLVIIS